MFVMGKMPYWAGATEAFSLLTFHGLCICWILMQQSIHSMIDDNMEFIHCSTTCCGFQWCLTFLLWITNILPLAYTTYEVWISVHFVLYLQLQYLHIQRNLLVFTILTNCWLLLFWHSVDRPSKDWDKVCTKFRKQGKKSMFSEFKPDKYVNWNPRDSDYPLSEEVDPIKRTERPNLMLWTSPKFTLAGAIVMVSMLLIYTL